MKTFSDFVHSYYTFFLCLFIGWIGAKSGYAVETLPTAATVVFPTGTTTNWVINVPANNAIRLHHNCPGWSIKVRRNAVEVVLRDQPFGQQSAIFQGPLELVFSVSNSDETAFAAYQIFGSTGLITQLYQGTGLLEVEVPAGKILKVVDTLKPGPDYFFAVKSADGTVSPQTMVWDAALASVFYPGPVTVVIGFGDAPKAEYLTYFLTDDLVALPDGVVQVSAVSAIVVEKSNDLVSWSTAGVLSSSNSPKTFYRLKAAQ